MDMETIRLILLQHAHLREVLRPRWSVALPLGTGTSIIIANHFAHDVLHFPKVGFPICFLTCFRAVVLFVTTLTALQ